MNGLSQCALNSPSILEAIVKRGFRHAGTPYPSGNRKRFAAECQWFGRRLVGALFKAGGPPAILRFVVSVVVDSVEAMRWCRSLSHVSKEVFKAVLPAVADGNSSTAVPSKACVLLVRAPLSHHLPDIELRSAGSTVAGNRLQLKAPTGSGGTYSERLPKHHSLAAALASAQPFWLLPGTVPGANKHSQATEFLARKVHERRHVFTVAKWPSAVNDTDDTCYMRQWRAKRNQLPVFT